MSIFTLERRNEVQEKLLEVGVELIKEKEHYVITNMMKIMAIAVENKSRIIVEINMILWTIQHKDAYEEMLKNGVLRGDLVYIMEESFEESYEWMADQMKKRIGNPPEGVIYPVWAWFRWEGKRKRPDMRFHGRGWGEKGTPIVLLTIDVPDSCVLLSDFDYWHIILNDGEIIFPYDESNHYSKEQRQKSWENIFDISCSFDGDKHQFLSTQATMWEIKAEWVVKVEQFISR